MSKGKRLKKITLLGLTTGLLAHSCLSGADANNNKDNSDSTKSLLAQFEDAKGGNYGYHLMDEDDLKLELNEEGLKTYNSLSDEGKRLARIVASSRCDGENICSGLNACKTDKNECMGKGSCKGQSKCSISDKNMAVKLVADKLAKERKTMLKK